MNDIIDFAYSQKGKNLYSNKKHSHGKSYEFVLVYAGKGSFTVKDKIFPLKPSCLYCIDGLETHCSSPENPTVYERHILVVKADFIDKLIKLTNCTKAKEHLFADGGKCLQLFDDSLTKLSRLFYEIKNSIWSNDGFAKAKIVSAILFIFENAFKQSNTVSPFIDGYVASAIEYVNENLSFDIRLDDICKAISLSKYHLCRLFKKEVGMTITDYVLSLRLSKAKKELLYTKKPISTISLDTGFSDFSYFCKIFKLHEGVTPSQFRNGIIL